MCNHIRYQIKGITTPMETSVCFSDHLTVACIHLNCYVLCCIEHFSCMLFVNKVQSINQCLNLATYAFNISPSSDNCSSPYYIVYGKEPIDAELKELEELHRYTGTNCGLKHLQQLAEIWKNHVDKLR